MDLIVIIGGLSALGALAALGVAFHHAVCLHKHSDGAGTNVRPPASMPTGTKS
jgi:hypothetical protein